MKSKFGLPENYQTWSEMIVNYFKQYPDKWRTQKQIRDGLGIKWVRPEHPDYYRFYNLNGKLKRLVEKGCLIRANSPDFLKTKARTIVFVYKWTGEDIKPDYRTSAIRLRIKISKE